VRCVILESPFAGQGRWAITKFFDRIANIRYARECLRDALGRGEAVFASHLLYTQRGVLRDWLPHERDRGIVAGQSWARRADYVVVYIDRGVSSGMDMGISLANALGMPIEFRSIRGVEIHTVEYNGESIH
jgi:hypothetical protein